MLYGDEWREHFGRVSGCTRQTEGTLDVLGNMHCIAIGSCASAICAALFIGAGRVARVVIVLGCIWFVYGRIYIVPICKLCVREKREILVQFSL